MAKRRTKETTVEETDDQKRARLMGEIIANLEAQPLSIVQRIHRSLELLVFHTVEGEADERTEGSPPDG